MRQSFIQRYLANNHFIAYTAVLIFCFTAFIISIGKGSVELPFSTVILIVLQEGLHIPLNAALDPMHVNIVMEIRLPRTLLAMMVGACLAVAGAAFQGFLKNPLADPYTLGVSSGAAVGAVVVLFFGISLPIIGQFTLPFVSIISGFLTLFLVIGFARIVQRSMSAETIILAGIIFSSFLGAFISLMISLTGDELRQIINWLMGSVAMRGWPYVYMIVPCFLIGFIMLFFNRHELNALAFGEETARQLGVNLKVRKLTILLGATIVTGGAVAVSGTIGFVGLVIPHLTRLLWGSDHKHLIPLSMFVGAGFLALTDLTARTVLAPTELPIGVITAIIGGPVFALILLKQRKIGR
ncbi:MULTISPECIES: FecCD family ABC transporter permease [Alkalihalophilus]|uniref:Ferric ion ABC transporter (Permease) n=1 Tax=Alkalihalophilus pseudofirmus (strain ATCC BAA-2126 / JCM 17055 / OF4) TaxID=398511 RepID=D3FZY3_ALKPO|nr:MULTISPECIES: iron ABC transporter permease [Alkalihalophilus]ADC51068.1 ferric ion ABC transporter (permease) [Alkalihalophilus pseudofirmus OF4]MEC2070751.1 iron ABC transporter permease [Alkalihalophilus marmarensis]